MKWREHTGTWRKTQSQCASRVPPSQFSSHPLPLPIVEGATVIFVEEKRIVCTGINRNRKWLICFFVHMLLHGTKRHNGSGSNIDRYGLKINGAHKLAPSFQWFPGPEVVPNAARQVHFARRSALLNHRRYQHVGSPQVLVWTRRCLGIVWVMEPQRAHHGQSSDRALTHNAIKIGEHPVAEFQIFAADRLDLLVVQLARIRKCRSIVISDLCRTGIASAPSPRQAQFPGTAVRSEQSAECPELEPSQVEFGRELLRRHESANVRTPIRNAGERSVDCDRHLRL